MRTQLTCFWIDDLKFFLDPKSKDVIAFLHCSEPTFHYLAILRTAWSLLCKNCPIAKPGWRGCVPAIDSNTRTIWIVDAHRDDGKSFVVHADEKLTAIVNLESAICAVGVWLQQLGYWTMSKSPFKSVVAYLVSAGLSPFLTSTFSRRLTRPRCWFSTVLILELFVKIIPGLPVSTALIKRSEKNRSIPRKSSDSFGLAFVFVPSCTQTKWIMAFK